MDFTEAKRNLITGLGLAPQELSKPFRAAISADIKISSNTIRQELECPICLSIFKDPTMSSVCGHVFCRTCITKQAEQNSVNFRCPTCSKKIDNEFIPATFMANILDKVIPNMHEFRAAEDKILKEQLAKHFSTFDPVLKEANSRHKSKRPAHNEDDKIEFRLLKDSFKSSLHNLKNSYVRIPQTVKASVILKLLENQLSAPYPNTLFVMTREGERKEIHRSMLLKDMKAYWDLLSPSSWIMYYTIKYAG